MFSNSVIEHVGPDEKQEAHAREVVRLGKTRVLSRRRMAELFPNARIRVEFLFGLPKSYVAYSPP